MPRQGIATDVAKVNTDSTLYGNEHELEKVSVTASRAPLAQGQQARMVTVLSNKDIAQAPVQSINDLIKYAAGVDVRQGDLLVPRRMSVRGGNYEQITILLNGINLNDPQTESQCFRFPL